MLLVFSGSANRKSDEWMEFKFENFFLSTGPKAKNKTHLFITNSFILF